ncbi:MAG: hypothetical protein JW809_09130 [Pirellulales bacterium]|nr:hypothetical protein [Pirellulales bacterium]
MVETLVGDGRDSLHFQTWAAIDGGIYPSIVEQWLGAGGSVQGTISAYAFADPVIRIDPLVEVDGEMRPWSDYGTLEVSPGIRVVETDFALWANPDGGSFETVGNWATWDQLSSTGPRLPEVDAEVEFGSFVGDNTYTVTAEADRALSKLRVRDAQTTLDLAGRTFTVRQLLEVGNPNWPHDQSLTLGGGTIECAADVAIHRGSLVLQQGAVVTSQGPVAMDEGVLELQAGSTMTSPTIHCSTWDDRIVLNGGNLTVGAINSSASGSSAIELNAGGLTLTSGQSNLSINQYGLEPFTVGNGLDNARLTVDGGQVWFRDVHIADEGLLELVSGSLNTAAITRAPGGTFSWLGGRLDTSTPLVVGADGLLGDYDLVLDQKTLGWSPSVTVRDGYLLSVAGGQIQTGELNLEPGGRFEYTAGKVMIASSEWEIGPEGMTGPGGNQTVVLNQDSDEIAGGFGSLNVREGYTLELARGTLSSRLNVEGTFDFGGPNGQPGQGRLMVGPGPTDLRIGDGMGAVINGRETVTIGSQGLISVDGFLTIDQDRTLEVLTPEADPNLVAWNIEVLGTLRLDGGQVRIPDFGGEIPTGGVVVRDCGTLEGSGTILGSVVQEGIVSPGMSPGVIHVTGNYEQRSAGWLTLEIDSATEFDRLIIDGQALLAGTIEIVFGDEYVPGTGGSWSLIEANGGIDWQVQQIIVSGAPAELSYSPYGLQVNVVPEPSTVALLACCGLMALAEAIRRRRR